jgi:uncharacterized protein
MTPPCPTCKKPVSEGKSGPSFPFCSQRCKLADLGSWLTGRYVVAGGELDEADLQALQLDPRQETS